MSRCADHRALFVSELEALLVRPRAIKEARQAIRLSCANPSFSSATFVAAGPLQHGDERWYISSANHREYQEKSFFHREDSERSRRPHGGSICKLAATASRLSLQASPLANISGRLALLQLFPDRFEAPVASVHFNSLGKYTGLRYAGLMPICLCSSSFWRFAGVSCSPQHRLWRDLYLAVYNNANQESMQSLLPTTSRIFLAGEPVYGMPDRPMQTSVR